MTIKDYPFEAGYISEIKPIGEYMRDLLNDKTAPVSERMRACEWLTKYNGLKSGLNSLAGLFSLGSDGPPLDALLNRYRNDIALFAKQVFGTELTADQIEFCEEFRTERTITRHEPPAWGKTYVAAIAIWWSLVCFDDVRVSIFGPCESAIRLGIWGSVQGLHARMAAPFKDMFDVSATRISRKTDAPSCFAEYRLASADNASAARGIHAVNNFVFVDDADGVSEIVIAYLMNIMIDPNPKLCLLSCDMSEFTKATTATETPAKPETVTEAELFNEALSSLRAMVSGEVRSDPVRLEAIRYQLENADYLSENATRAD